MGSRAESHHTKRHGLTAELPGARFFRRRKVDHVNFVVAGVQKAGTTALHDFLAQHPHVALLRDQALHFFDKEEHFGSRRAGLVTETDYDVLLENFDSGCDGASPEKSRPIIFIIRAPSSALPDTTRT